MKSRIAHRQPRYLSPGTVFHLKKSLYGPCAGLYGCLCAETLCGCPCAEPLCGPCAVSLCGGPGCYIAVGFCGLRESVRAPGLAMYIRERTSKRTAHAQAQKVFLEPKRAKQWERYAGTAKRYPQKSILFVRALVRRLYVASTALVRALRAHWANRHSRQSCWAGYLCSQL